MAQNTSEMTAKDILRYLEEKYKNNRTTKIFLVKGGSGRQKINYNQISKQSKTVWILVETTNIRINVRSEIAKEFGISETSFLSTSGSSVDHIKIDNYKKTKSNEHIRIMFKSPMSFDRKNYKWKNQALIDLSSKSKLNLGNPDNRDEAETLKKINRKIQEYGGKVTLRMGNKTFENVIGLNAGPSGAKADFVIIDEKGKEIGFISYKAGSTPTDFQQYSGISRLTGPRIYRDREVIKFRKKIVEEGWEGITGENKLISSVYIKIKNSHLKKCAIFGKEFGRKRGIHNVDFFAQGMPVITVKKTNGKINLILLFSKKTVPNGRLTKLGGDYDPVLAARKGEGSRRITFDVYERKEGKLSVIDTKEVKGIRGGIWAEGNMKSRNSKEIK